MTTVAVLLATKNGAEYIEEFINSLLAQKLEITKLIISDDQSQDSTVAKICALIEGQISLEILQGPNLGSTKNFFHLLNNSGEYDYYAFADQDDIWFSNHLSRSIELMSTVNSKPFAVFSPTTSRMIKKQPNSQNVKSEVGDFLLNNPARGCTIVFNCHLKKLLLSYDQCNLKYHDWWTMILAATHGEVHKFIQPSVMYRSHTGQQIGGQEGLRFAPAKMRRFDASLRESFKMCERANSQLVENVYENSHEISLWLSLKNTHFLRRMQIIRALKPKITSRIKTYYAYWRIIIFRN